MDQIMINSENGKYVIVLKEIETKDCAFVYIEKAINLESLLEEAKKIATNQGAGNVFYKYDCKEPPLYEIHQYTTPKAFYKSNKEFRLMPISLENRSFFSIIANKSYSRFLSGKTWTQSDLLDAIRNKKRIGFVTYRRAIIGIYEIEDNVIKSFAIDDLFRQKGFGYEGLKKIITRINSDVKILVSSDNEIATRLLKKLNFEFECVLEKWYKID